MHTHDIIRVKMTHLVVGHTLSYTVSNFGVNWTNGSRDAGILYPHPYSYSNTARICKIKAEEKLDYLLCILGKEDYATMGRWVPADETHKNNPVKFSDYIESTLDDEISPWVHVYELEDITKMSEESIDELVDWICQLAQRA